MGKRDKYHPDYRKLYPGVKISPEVLRVLKQSDRKMRCLEIDIKHGTFQQDSADFAPSREDSLERLLEDEGLDFVSTEPSPEDIIEHIDEINRLRDALKMLKPEEFALIYAIFFENTSETTMAIQTGITHQGISKRLKAIYRKIIKNMKI